jgi:hypothetical protein
MRIVDKLHEDEEVTIYRNHLEGLMATVTLVELGPMRCYHRVEFRDTDADEVVAIRYYPTYSAAEVGASEFCNGRKA